MFFFLIKRVAPALFKANVPGLVFKVHVYHQASSLHAPQPHSTPQPHHAPQQQNYQIHGTDQAATVDASGSRPSAAAGSFSPAPLPIATARRHLLACLAGTNLSAFLYFFSAAPPPLNPENRDHFSSSTMSRIQQL
jgi:hypothetical protein